MWLLLKSVFLIVVSGIHGGKKHCSHAATEPVLGLLSALLMLTRHSRKDRHLQEGESHQDTNGEVAPTVGRQAGCLGEKNTS